MSASARNGRLSPVRSPSGQQVAWLAAGLTAAALAARQARQTPPTSEQLRAAALDVLEAALPQKRPFDVQLWDGTVLPATVQPAAARLILNSEHSLGRMLRLPLDIALGEAYLRGDFEIEGDVSAVAGLTEAFDKPLSAAQIARLLGEVQTLRRHAGPAPHPVTAQLHGEPHTRERDQQAVTYHYDISNDFYKLWLDHRMVYSCGYFPTGAETLDQAQEAKLEHICRKLRLEPGERLLDIGCGWGGLAIYAAEHYGVEVLGVTLSEAQLREGRARVEAAGLGDLVRLELRDYRDVQGQFDKISSVGMAEHVGRRNMPEYFATAYRVLKPGGLMMNHAIAAGVQQSKLPKWVQVLASGNFNQKYVFPDGELLPLWETLQHAEQAQFEVRDVENLREHYARTLANWSRNLEAHRDEARALVGEQRFRLWRLYLAACVNYFRNGQLAIFQSLLAKPDEEGRAGVPLSRGDVYR
ncbi:class I SAM-dependent methyltransferase [Deinococcus metallilatus]|uniref:Class I SAM-dependent methyltransferase n=1 Tax=Deinococcus metallilatus TaxID=1211322 RepID=A0AAJ5F467_9DEIO|nr:cyclopropane-fatty-acyl-phospholipid synthase family protein [Deinococcus metallilatus]MBB5294474.1 cyclopropane-fatty-acyl-phospholipid synthase [Deinococcus metallilatus]QBY07528.1 class I SAM-dependent methyltransferase [Deinococcus metallilatus]RXJ13944.1 class I SAM-dependent methyltransferase [Deinococcus metallilatus]TLK29909.1 class I SAM-dependent methyltransferase [Deinococcus metallilatus]